MEPHLPAMSGKQMDTAADGAESTHTAPGNATSGEGVASGRVFGSRFGLLEADISSRSPLAKDGGPERPQAPYMALKSATVTTLPPDAPNTGGAFDPGRQHGTLCLVHQQ